MKTALVTFDPEGCRLAGDLYTSPDLQLDERRAGIVLCHGYTGVEDLYLPDRQSAELAAAAHREVPSGLNTLPLRSATARSGPASMCRSVC